MPAMNRRRFPVLATVLLSLVAPRIAHAQSRPYRAIDLGVVPGQSPVAGVTAAAISRDGSRIGGTSVWEPYVWERGFGMRALAKLAGRVNGEVQDVNDAGIAVGSCGLGTVSMPTTAVVWDRFGKVQAIGGLGGMFSTCIAINDAGTVIGRAEVSVNGVRFNHAFTWTAAGGIVDLTPGVAVNSTAYDINDAGQLCLLVGSAAYRSTPGVGLESMGGVLPTRINEYGQMAGKDMSTGTAGRWTDGVGWEMFAAGSTVQLSDIGGIDSFGRIGGTQSIRVNSSPPSYRRHGHLWVEGLGFQRLDDWIDPAQVATVKRVHGVTDDGAIVADGSIGSDNRAMLLEPTMVTPFGSACAGGSGRAPRLGASGWPRPGGKVAILGAGGPRAGAGVVVFSPRTASLPLPGGCTLLVDPLAGVTVPVALNPIGQGSIVLTVPGGTPAHSLWLQLATWDPAAVAATLAASNGVRIDVR